MYFLLKISAAKIRRYL